MTELVRVRCVVPHDRMERFEHYELEDTPDLQTRIQKGYLEFIEYAGEEEE